MCKSNIFVTRTNREDALSPLGIEQVQDACNAMMSRDINPSVVKYSLAAKSIDSANVVASEMKVGINKQSFIYSAHYCLF